MSEGHHPATDEPGIDDPGLPGARLVAAVAAAALAVPALRMLRWVAAGTPAQFADYWYMLEASLQPSGAVDVAGVLAPHNEHLVVFPKVLYLLNVRLAGGSNVVLGFAVVAIALSSLALLTVHLGRRRGINPAVLIAFAVAASAVTFVPHGAWSYLRAMSGAAWLTANLLAVAAILVAGRGRALPAALLAAAAAASYGTGLVSLPAVVVTGLLVDRRLARQWPALVAAVPLVAVYVRIHQDIPHSGLDPDRSISKVVRGSFELIGAVLTEDPDGAVRIGAAVVVVGLVLLPVAWWSAGKVAAPWIGLMLYALGAVVLIVYGRSNALTTFTTSRYTSLGALVWVAVLGLLALVGRRRQLMAVPLVAVACLTVLGSTGPVTDVAVLEARQRELSNALALDVAGGARPYFGYGAPIPHFADALRATSHHPFDGRWDADCGLLGERVPARLVREPGAHGLGGHVGPTFGSGRVPLADEAVGEVDQPDDVRCIVAADEDGRVVGIGQVSTTDATTSSMRFGRGGFRVLAPRGGGPLTVYVILDGSDVLHRLPSEG